MSRYLLSAYVPGKTHYIDLLNQDLEAAYQDRPERLAEELDALNDDVKIVVIDEIQKAPALPNVVHRYIEKERFSFALIGSSARTST